MATFTLKIETHSAAIAEDGREHEIVRILRATAERVENGHDSGILLDINGARVGSWEMDLPVVSSDEDDNEDDDED